MSEEKHECSTCKFGKNYENGYDVTTMNDECGGCCSWNDKWQAKEDKELDFLPHKKIPVNLTITKIYKRRILENDKEEGAELTNEELLEMSILVRDLTEINKNLKKQIDMNEINISRLNTELNKYQFQLKKDGTELTIKVLEQEPFINKPCVSSGVCEHDKNKVLDKIRADIEQTVKEEKKDDERWASGLRYSLKIIDKYRAESEDKE